MANLHPRHRNATARVYFIRPVGMQGPVKIGCSVLPETRKNGLQTWCPFPLELVAQIEGPRRMEHQFHALFSHQHSHGEWFHWSPELEQVMAAVRAGIFPIELLPPPIFIGCPPGGRKWSEATKAALRERRAAERARAAEDEARRQKWADARPQPRGIMQ